MANFPPNLNIVDWDKLYDTLGARDFVNFISSPHIQDMLFPEKVVFIFFTVFFFCAMMYFYANSSYIKYNFLQGFADAASSDAGGRQTQKRLLQITKRIESGSENEYKLAIIEADDFLVEVLESKGFKGDNFEELISNASENVLPNSEHVLESHTIRNSVVYDLNYKLDLETAKSALSSYEEAIKSMSAS